MRHEAGEGTGAIVNGIEYLGADSLVEVHIESHASRLTPHALLVRVPGRAAARAGDSVTVTWHPHNEHHFDKTTGERIQ